MLLHIALYNKRKVILILLPLLVDFFLVIEWVGERVRNAFRVVEVCAGLPVRGHLERLRVFLVYVVSSLTLFLFYLAGMRFS